MPVVERSQNTCVMRERGCDHKDMKDLVARKEVVERARREALRHTVRTARGQYAPIPKTRRRDALEQGARDIQHGAREQPVEAHLDAQVRDAVRREQVRDGDDRAQAESNEYGRARAAVRGFAVLGVKDDVRGNWACVRCAKGERGATYRRQPGR